MLNILVTFLLSLLVSLDGYVIGFSFGLKRIRIPLSIVMMIAGFSSVVILISMGVGHLIGELVPTKNIQVFAGLLLIGAGLYHFLQDPPLYRRSYFLMIALFMNIDNIGYGIQAGLAQRPLSFAPLAGLLLCVSMVVGVIHGQETKNRFLLRYVSIAPALLFILLGLSKVLLS
ncbi:manganese efflux pump [Halalkalibacter oceani]|uniref:Manganese efflux pump n=1 Tax=Halalkalibacter oceani TaxID=1653776 RepID=A0A9X2DPY0_9BACI|nr:manganese efflux pump [Halalkalibacter oceani]MCM3713985.1 manganese efflux pump [Halalkalibacter oceani]